MASQERILSSRKRPKTSEVLFLYSTSHLSALGLVKFYYELKGRDGKSGIIKKTKSKFLAKGAILASKKSALELQELFSRWRCKIEKKILHYDLSPNKILFTYSTKHFDNTQKVRFYYAFKGRGGKPGILSETESEFLTKGVILTKIEHEAELARFFAQWRCSFKRRKARIENG